MCSVFFERAVRGESRCVFSLVRTGLRIAVSADRILLLDRVPLSGASIETLVAGMTKITITLEDRELVEYIRQSMNFPG